MDIRGMTVNDILARFPETISIFNDFGIDACCGGAVSLRDAAKFGPWLMQIARRQVVESVRARRVPVVGCAVDSPCEAVRDNSRDWIEHEHLLNLVARLPDRERVLIGQRYFDGQSMDEIAASTGRPIGTVTKQLSRAVARLRSWWDKENMR